MKNLGSLWRNLMKLNDHVYYYPEQEMLECNTYVFKDQRTLLIDAGPVENLSTLARNLKTDGIDPETIDIIANTHLHMDHAQANQTFKGKFGSRIEIAPVQKKFYDAGVRQTALFFNMEPVDFKEDGLLDLTINLGAIEIQVIETPGHSPDSICFYCPQFKTLICGDLVFQYNIGRPDLPGGDFAQLKHSIEKISALDVHLLLPGHMNIIDGKDRVKDNFDFLLNNIL